MDYGVDTSAMVVWQVRALGCKSVAREIRVSLCFCLRRSQNTNHFSTWAVYATEDAASAVGASIMLVSLLAFTRVADSLHSVLRSCR